jgi:hypothetical protein
MSFWNQDPNVVSTKNPTEFFSDICNIQIPIAKLNEITIFDWLWKLDIDGLKTTDMGLDEAEPLVKKGNNTTIPPSSTPPPRSYNDYELLTNKQKKAGSASEPIGTSAIQFEPLIYQVKTTKLETSIQYKLFEVLIQSYNPAVNQREVLTKEKLTLISIFLDCVLQSEVMKLAFLYIKHRLGYKYFNYQRFKGTLFYIWFALHTLIVVDPTTKVRTPKVNPIDPPATNGTTTTPASSLDPGDGSLSANSKRELEQRSIAKVQYSSAFEHVFVGEIQLNKKPRGNHNNDSSRPSTQPTPSPSVTPSLFSPNSTAPVITSTSTLDLSLQVPLNIPPSPSPPQPQPQPQTNAITPMSLSQPTGLFSPNPTFDIHELKLGDELLSNESLIPGLMTSSLGDTYLSQNQYVQSFLNDLSYTFLDSDSSDEESSLDDDYDDDDDNDSDCENGSDNNCCDDTHAHNAGLDCIQIPKDDQDKGATSPSDPEDGDYVNIDTIIDLPILPNPTIVHSNSNTCKHHRVRPSNTNTPGFSPSQALLRRASVSRRVSATQPSGALKPNQSPLLVDAEHPNDVGVSLVDDFKLYIQSEEQKAEEKKKEEEERIEEAKKHIEEETARIGLNNSNTGLLHAHKGRNKNHAEQNHAPNKSSNMPSEEEIWAKREARRLAKKIEIAKAEPTRQERYLKRMEKIQRKYNQQLFTKTQCNGVVLGLHYWYTYYLLERAHNIQYLGHKFNKNSLCKLDAPFISLRFLWNLGNKSFIKDRGSMFLGCSPAFLLAFSTVAFFEVQSVTDATHHNPHRYDLDYEYDNETQTHAGRKDYHQKLSQYSYKTSSRVPNSTSPPVSPSVDTPVPVITNSPSFSTPNAQSEAFYPANYHPSSRRGSATSATTSPLTPELTAGGTTTTTTTTTTITHNHAAALPPPPIFICETRHNHPKSNSNQLSGFVKPDVKSSSQSPTISIRHDKPKSGRADDDYHNNNEIMSDKNDNNQHQPKYSHTNAHKHKTSSRNHTPDGSLSRNSSKPAQRTKDADYLISSSDLEQQNNDDDDNDDDDDDDGNNPSSRRRGRNKMIDNMSQSSRNASNSSRGGNKTNNSNFKNQSPHRNSSHNSQNRINGNTARAQQHQFEEELRYHAGNARIAKNDPNHNHDSPEVPPQQVYEHDIGRGRENDRQQIGLGWASLPSATSNFITRRVIDGFVYEIIVCKEKDFLVSVYNNLIGKADEMELENLKGVSY